jgi:hypothetical protein
VHNLSTSSLLNAVTYEAFGSDPWSYRSGDVGSFSTAINYVSGQAATALPGITGVASTANLIGESWQNSSSPIHNVLQIDLGFLTGMVPVGQQVYFSYVMACGNDSLKGQYGGGFDRVPDGGTSIVLLGLGLVGLSFIRMRFLKA